MEVATFSSLCQGFFLLLCSAASFVVSTIEICRVSSLFLSLYPSPTAPLPLQWNFIYSQQHRVHCRHGYPPCWLLLCGMPHCTMWLGKTSEHTAQDFHIYIIYIYICIYSCSLLFKFQLYLRSTISHKAAVAAANNKSCQLHKKLAKMPPKGCGCTLTKFVAFLCNLLSSWIKYFLAFKQKNGDFSSLFFSPRLCLWLEICQGWEWLECCAWLCLQFTLAALEKLHMLQPAPLHSHAPPLLLFFFWPFIALEFHSAHGRGKGQVNRLSYLSTTTLDQTYKYTHAHTQTNTSFTHTHTHLHTLVHMKSNTRF